MAPDQPLNNSTSRCQFQESLSKSVASDYGDGYYVLFLGRPTGLRFLAHSWHARKLTTFVPSPSS